MSRQQVLLTGATGAMGFLTLQALLEDADAVSLTVLALPDDASRRKLKPYSNHPALRVVWGDLTNPEDVKRSVRGMDIVLHVGALVSPVADDKPLLAMRVNYGGTASILNALVELGQSQTTKLVNIGSVAETGDRMPPIHWGRVGDPIKPSVFDYYAVSKVAAERAVIESDLQYWVSLRQTGIIGAKMAAIDDAIMFHNGLNNVLEYVSDRDAARMLRNLCTMDRKGLLTQDFWGHIFNVGGGAFCRASTYALYRELFGRLGFTRLADVMEANWSATRNFHGQYFLDSDKLNNLLDFRRDSLAYFYDSYQRFVGTRGRIVRAINVLGGEKHMGNILKKHFACLARTAHGTLHFVEQGMEGHIAAYWGSRKAWETIEPLEQFVPFSAWEKVMHIDHGYDETKPEALLSLADMQGAARFRGGACLSGAMVKGDWCEKLLFRCAFDHRFTASPRLVLEGGHWCPHCEQKSWNYHERARVDPFFAQVWDPLHPKDEQPWYYPKKVSQDDVWVA